MMLSTQGRLIKKNKKNILSFHSVHETSHSEIRATQQNCLVLNHLKHTHTHIRSLMTRLC